MIAYNAGGAHFNIHGTSFIADLAIDASGYISAQFGDPDKIEQALQGPIGTGILTPGALNKERGQHGHNQDNHAANGDFTRPEVEKRVIGVNIGKNQSQ